MTNFAFFKKNSETDKDLEWSILVKKSHYLKICTYSIRDDRDDNRTEYRNHIHKIVKVFVSVSVVIERKTYPLFKNQKNLNVARK